MPIHLGGDHAFRPSVDAAANYDSGKRPVPTAPDAIRMGLIRPVAATGKRQNPTRRRCDIALSLVFLPIPSYNRWSRVTSQSSLHRCPSSNRIYGT